MKNQPTLDRGGAQLPRPGAVITATLLCGCAALFAGPAPAPGPEANEEEGRAFRVGFTSALFTDVNENDAKAAVKVWGQTIAKEQGIPVEVVLPVFFGQSDACVVTRSGFETMRELNPQVGKRLKIIAASAEMVPVVFCFRADYSPSFREQLLAGVRDLHKTPAGQQVLALFKSDALEDHPASCLDSAFELLAAYDRLSAPTNGFAAQAMSSGLRPKRGGR